MPKNISGICISANYDEEITHISKLIHDISPKTKIIRFRDVLEDISLLEKCDFIFTLGGDGSVAWLIGSFFSKFGSKNLIKLKPIVPVIRPKSVGYLKQLDFDEKKFHRRFTNIMKNKYSVLQKSVLKIKIDKKEYLAVNEINYSCSPHIGKFSAFLLEGKKYHKITTTMADAAFVVTPIGSTGWALSYGGPILLNEESLELVFAGGIHSSANFVLPRKKIKIQLDLKNSPIMPDTIHAFETASKKRGIKIFDDTEKTLNVVYGPRVMVDGKLIAFDVECINIDPSLTVPMVYLYRETSIDKARKLTKFKKFK